MVLVALRASNGGQLGATQAANRSSPASGCRVCFESGSLKDDASRSLTRSETHSYPDQGMASHQPQYLEKKCLPWRTLHRTRAWLFILCFFSRPPLARRPIAVRAGNEVAMERRAFGSGGKHLHSASWAVRRAAAGGDSIRITTNTPHRLRIGGWRVQATCNSRADFASAARACEAIECDSKRAAALTSHRRLVCAGHMQ